MEEIPISKFKATCLAVLEKVRRTGESIRVTRHGKVIAEIVPSTAAPAGKFRLGGMEGKFKITGDLIAPVLPPEAWEVLRDEDPAGYSHLDLERKRPRPRARKGKKSSRKSG